MIIEEVKQAKGLLNGKTALVTGGAGGIGGEASKALAYMGAKVIIADYNTEKGDNLIEEITSLCGDGSAEFCRVDLLIEEDIKKLADYILQKYGFVDILLNIAAIFQVGGIEETSSEDWDNSYKINFKAPIMLTKMFLPSMRKRNTGIVVFTATPGIVPYMSASDIFKSAQYSLCDALADELAGSNIYTYTITPTYVKTESSIKAIGDAMSRIGKTASEFFENNYANVMFPQKVGGAFAISVIEAEKYNGRQLEVAQLLLAAAEKKENRDFSDTAAAAMNVVALYGKLYEIWQSKNIFERQWIMRDFKKITGMTIDQFKTDMSYLEKCVAGQNYKIIFAHTHHYEKLKRFLEQQYSEKNDKSLNGAEEEWIALLDNIIHCVKK